MPAFIWHLQVALCGSKKWTGLLIDCDVTPSVCKTKKSFFSYKSCVEVSQKKKKKKKWVQI